MKAKISKLIGQDKVFIWIALITGAVLLIPFIAMQLTDEVAWTLFDFVVMGALLFGMGSLFVLTARRAGKKYLAVVGLVFALAFLYLWVELAVGIFTDLGS